MIQTNKTKMITPTENVKNAVQSSCIKFSPKMVKENGDQTIFLLADAMKVKMAESP